MRPWLCIRLALGVAAGLLATSACLRMAPTPDSWPCETDAECGPTGRCVEAVCRYPSDCGDASCEPPGTECLPGSDPVCAPFRCRADHRCQTQCGDSSDCFDTTATCRSGQCVAGRCADLDEAAECAGYACVAGRCREVCAGPIDCAQGFSCFNTRCSRNGAANGATCMSSSECDSGNCCPSTTGGEPSVCVSICRGLPVGEPCLAAEECVSSSCFDGRCAACASPPCSDPCSGVDCGSVDGVDCGACPVGLVCTSGACSNPCVGIDCGSVDGVDCGACPVGLICTSGACNPPPCTPENTYRCEGDEVRFCPDNGVEQLVAVCDGNEYCREGRAACSTHDCEPEKGFCEETLFVPCDQAGRPDPAQELDCESDQLTCTPNGCATLETDVVSTPSPAAVVGQTTCGNIYLVERDVTLSTITQELGDSTATARWWFAYQADTVAGPYHQVVAAVMAIAASPPDTLTSPPLGLALNTGTFYFLGLSSVDSEFITSTTSSLPQELSFGQLIGGACSLDGLDAFITNRTDVGVAVQTLETLNPR